MSQREEPLRWRIGRVGITRVPEVLNVIPGTAIFEKATPEALAPHADWLRPHFADAEGQLVFSIHSLVVEAAGGRILVDTCVGPSAPPEHRYLANPDFLDDLASAGFPADSIDVVLCTHLHFDHVGWNTTRVDGRLVPTFRNARYLFARAEWEHWSASPGGYAANVDETVRPIVEAGLADLIETDHRLCDEVWLEPSPGHTPGHVCVRIASEGREALITGDATHHPVQWAEPEWSAEADDDPAQAAATRRRLAARYADGGVLLIGTHYAPPTSGWLVTRDGRVRFAASAD